MKNYCIRDSRVIGRDVDVYLNLALANVQSLLPEIHANGRFGSVGKFSGAKSVRQTSFPYVAVANNNDLENLLLLCRSIVIPNVKLGHHWRV